MTADPTTCACPERFARTVHTDACITASLNRWVAALPALTPTAREQRVNDLAGEVDGGDVEDDPQMGYVAAGQWEDRWERQGRWIS